MCSSRFSRVLAAVAGAATCAVLLAACGSASHGQSLPTISRKAALSTKTTTKTVLTTSSLAAIYDRIIPPKCPAGTPMTIKTIQTFGGYHEDLYKCAPGNRQIAKDAAQFLIRQQEAWAHPLRAGITETQAQQILTEATPPGTSLPSACRPTQPEAVPASCIGQYAESQTVTAWSKALIPLLSRQMRTLIQYEDLCPSGIAKCTPLLSQRLARVRVLARMIMDGLPLGQGMLMVPSSRMLFFNDSRVEFPTQATQASRDALWIPAPRPAKRGQASGVLLAKDAPTQPGEVFGYFCAQTHVGIPIAEWQSTAGGRPAYDAGWDEEEGNVVVLVAIVTPAHQTSPLTMALPVRSSARSRLCPTSAG